MPPNPNPTELSAMARQAAAMLRDPKLPRNHTAISLAELYEQLAGALDGQPQTRRDTLITRGRTLAAYLRSRAGEEDDEPSDIVAFREPWAGLVDELATALEFVGTGEALLALLPREEAPELPRAAGLSWRTTVLDMVDGEYQISVSQHRSTIDSLRRAGVTTGEIAHGCDVTLRGACLQALRHLPDLLQEVPDESAI